MGFVVYTNEAPEQPATPGQPRKRSARPANKEPGDIKDAHFFGFLAVVLVALIGGIVLYAIGKDAAAQVILPIGTGLLGTLTGLVIGEKAATES